MPTLQHEFPLRLIRDNPSLAADLVRLVSPIELPEEGEIVPDSENLSTLINTEHRADAVVVRKDRHDKVVFAYILEVQRGFDPETRDQKRRAWVAYAANLFARYGCPVEILVLCTNDTVAEKCREPIHVTLRGFSLEVLVVGPAELPVITESDVAIANPELAVLSFIANVKGKQRKAAIEALDAALVGHPNQQVAVDYVMCTYDLLEGADREWMEDWMKTMDRPYYGALAKKLRSEGRVEGRSEGRVEGRSEGRVEGRSEGRVEGEASAVIGVLEARGLSVSQREREMILGSQDLEQVRGWLRRAVKVDRAAELFD